MNAQPLQYWPQTVEYCPGGQCSTAKDGKMSLRDTFVKLIAGPQPPPLPDLGRNDRCWCGSGRKYKLCHQTADDRKRAAARPSPSLRRR